MPKLTEEQAADLVTDEMVEAACKTYHSPTAWGKTIKKPTMVAWANSHRNLMRKVLVAALSEAMIEPPQPLLYVAQDIPEMLKTDPAERT